MSAIFTSYVENNFPEYQHIQSVVTDGGQDYGVSFVKFDTYEELLWIGNQWGHVTSYFGDHLERYTSFQAQHNEEIKCLLPIDYGLLSLTSNALKLNTRQGFPQLDLKFPKDFYGTAQCMISQDPNITLIGGHVDKILQFDANKYDQQIQIPLESGAMCTLMKLNDKYLFTGDPSGKISIRDTRTAKSEHQIQAHAGSLSDFDVYGNMLVSCGLFERHGNMTYERFLKIYDIRTMKPMPPFQVKIDPAYLRFIHTYTDRVLIVSQSGSYQLLDPKAAISPPGLVYNFSTHGALVSCMDVSSNYKALALGDMSGCLHLHNTNQNDAQAMEGRLIFNDFSRPTPFPEVLPQDPYPYMAIDNYGIPFSTIPFPGCHIQGQALASDWPEHLIQKYDRRPLPIDQAVLDGMKISHFVGYAQNPPGRIPNLVPYDLSEPQEFSESPYHQPGPYPSSSFQTLFPHNPSTYHNRPPIPPNSATNPRQGGPNVPYRLSSSTYQPPYLTLSGSASSSSAAPSVAAGAVSSSPSLSAFKVGGIGEGRIPTPTLSSATTATSCPFPIIPDVGKGHESFVESVILIPQIYQKQVLHNAWPHVDNLNFKDYNPTPFATLEYTSPNSYINVIIQILYFVEPFRNQILNHLCEKEYCLSCELAFLFHMMNMTTNNEPCQPLNFLRAFKNLREASALGLILEEKEFGASSAVQSASSSSGLAGGSDTKVAGIDKHAMVENFNRFIYPQIHADFMLAAAASTASNPKSEGDGETEGGSNEALDTSGVVLNDLQIASPIHDFFVTKICEVLTCVSCHETFPKTASVFSFTLKYPQDVVENGKATVQTKRTNNVPLSFGDFVKRSMLFSQDTRAFCEVCKRFQPMTQTKRIKKLPQVLIFSCQTQDQEKREFWRVQQELFTQRMMQRLTSAAAKALTLDPAPDHGNDSFNSAPNPSERSVDASGDYRAPPCRYGDACRSVARCKFYHPPGSHRPTVREGNKKRPKPVLPKRRTWIAPSLTFYMNRTDDDRGTENLVVRDIDAENNQMGCAGDTSGNIVTDETVLLNGSPSYDKSVYDLMAIVVSVKDPKGLNLVDYINLTEPNFFPPTNNWYLFNDFCVFKVTESEALDFDTNWKTPCILYFTKRPHPVPAIPATTITNATNTGTSTAAPVIPSPSILSPLRTVGKRYLLLSSSSTTSIPASIGSSSIKDTDSPSPQHGVSREGGLWVEDGGSRTNSPLRSKLAQQRHQGDVLGGDSPTSGSSSRRFPVIPLDFEGEDLDPGSFLISLDAEFVVLNQQEAHLHSDGTHTMVKPSQMALARISCVRGYMPSPLGLNDSQKLLESKPFLDEYICVPGNQVVDYVTKYSGIKHGDLDVHTSSKNPVGLKTVYLQLRYLVDSGFTFVGHNIRKDFQIINITVPSAQIVDTAILFSLPKKRTISLKFLVWYYFRQIIQQDTHDSVEDAVCALKLYKLYLDLTAKMTKEKFAQSLKDLYQKGHSLAWEVPAVAMPTN